MNLKKIWPVLALVGAGALFWLWHANRLQLETGSKTAITPSTPSDAPAARIPAPVPEPPASPPAGPEARLPSAPPPPQAELPAPETQAPSPPEPAPNYAVEVKKFRTFQQAKKFLTQLRKQGHQAYIAKQPQAKSPFGVWLGPFQNRQQAQAAAQAVRKKYRVSPQVRTQPALPPK